jgi:hypothetical protein
MSWTTSEAFKEISKGDAAAEDFMRRFYCWVHMRDDLIDKDKVVAPDVAAGFDLTLLHAFAQNSFFQKNQDYLWPVLMTSALAWVASEDRQQSQDVLERIIAQILKSEYVNVFFAVAFLVGGWDHAVKMSRQFREYAFDNELVKTQKIGHTKEEG